MSQKGLAELAHISSYLTYWFDSHSESYDVHIRRSSSWLLYTINFSLAATVYLSYVFCYLCSCFTKTQEVAQNVNMTHMSTSATFHHRTYVEYWCFKFLSFLHRDITFHKRMHLRLDFFPPWLQERLFRRRNQHICLQTQHIVVQTLFSNITQPSFFKLPDRVFFSCVSHKPSLSPPTHCLS